LFERFFGPKESGQKIPSREELESRSKEFELRLKDLIGKRDDMRRRMRLLEREQDDFEHGRKPLGSNRTLADILCDKGGLLQEMDKIQREINRAFEEMQRDDEALKRIRRNKGPS